MRTFILLLVTGCLLALGYGVYWVMLGAEDGLAPATAGGRAAESLAQVTRPTTGPAIVGPGERVWVERFDKRTGDRTTRFRAQRYEPQPDGRVLVIGPEVEFFLARGQVIRVTGERGHVNMEEGASRGSTSFGRNVNQSPRSGELYGVTLQLLPSAGPDVQPTLVMRTHNASFDNETYQIATEAYSEGGRVIAGEKVAVTIRGDDFEFDGRGLKLQYNELDRRLEYLRIAQGQRLLVKNPEKFFGNETGEKPASGDVPPEAGSRRFDHPDQKGHWARGAPLPGIVLAAADDQAIAEAATSVSRRADRAASAMEAAAVEPDEPVYRAVFKQAVEITQSGRTIAVAEDLQVDFLNDPGESQPSTRPGEPPAEPLDRAARRRRDRAGRMPDTDRRGRAERPDALLDDPNQPIEIRWNGPLTIVPLASDRPERIAPGEYIVKLLGSAARPVEVVREVLHQGSILKTHLRCMMLTHWTIDSGALLESGQDVPVEVIDSRGTHIVTGSIRFSQAEATALLLGKSHARLPIDDSEGTASPERGKEFLEVDWTDRCTLYVEGRRMEEMALRRADLQGSVAVKHPDLALSSNVLQLWFDADGRAGAGAPAATRPARSSPQLRKLAASGTVECITAGPRDAADIRKVNCDNLELTTGRTGDGRLYARHITAIGQVHAVDRERDVKAGFVRIALAEPRPSPATMPAADPADAAAAPATRPASKFADLAPGELERLAAHDNVRVVTASGEAAEADQIVIEIADGQPKVTLHGRPARASKGRNSITGPIIVMLPETEELTVVGAGRLEGMQENQAGGAQQPVEVTWHTSLRAHGPSDTVQCFGKVTARSVDLDGTVNTARAERITLVTARLPAEAGAEATADPAQHAGAAAARPETQPTTRRSGDFELLADRGIRSIVLEEDAQVDSILNDAAGKLLRVFQVKSASIRYNRDTGRLTIPQAGTMLFADERPPAANVEAEEADRDPFNLSGRTAFSWEESLVYDEAAHQVTLLGSVKVGRLEQAAQPEQTVLLMSEKVIAYLEPIPEAPAASRPGADDAVAGQAGQGAPGGLLGAVSPKVQLKRVEASGGVRITGDKLNLYAETVEYNPASHLLSLRGTERSRVIQYNQQGVEVASFDWVIFNTETGQIQDSKGMILKSRQ